ncbi:MAG: alpha/beta hydrolase [candidate division NC10 bacterium]|nr:alpha/beta hydrolase [candidate division NC10 bacterium]
MPFVQVSGKRIHYVQSLGVRGDVPLVFVHGAGGTHENWLHQLRGLSCRYPVLAVDLPGHGRSEGNGFQSIEAYRDFVRDFLDVLDIRRAILVGHSMGGAVALSFALVYSTRLTALVLVGTGVRLKVHPKVFEALRGDPQEAVHLLVGWAYAETASLEMIRQGEAKWLEGSPMVVEGDFLACNAFDLMDEVERIVLPTLILCGTKDRLTPVNYAEHLHQKIQGSSLALIPGAGHMVMIERPEAVNQALHVFLQQIV